MCIHGQDRLRQDGGLAAAAGAGPRPCPDPSARRPSGRTAGGRSAGHERRRGRRLPRQGLRKGAHAGFTHIDPACPCSRHRLITDRHATPQSMPLLNAIPRIRGVRGRPRHRLGWLFAGLGYDSDKYRRLLRVAASRPRSPIGGSRAAPVWAGHDGSSSGPSAGSTSSSASGSATRYAPHRLPDQRGRCPCLRAEHDQASRLRRAEKVL